MKRRILLHRMGGLPLLAPLLAGPVAAQPANRVRTVGVTFANVGTDPEAIVSGIFTLLDDKAAYSAMARAHNPFGDGQSAARIARIVADGFGC